MSIQVPVIEYYLMNTNKLYIPAYASEGASGVDLVAAESVLIPAQETKIIPTGLLVAIPWGFEGQVRPRSGLALREGLTVLNTPGTIDSDYRGEIKVLIYNTSKEAKRVQKGDRFAQLVISPVAKAKFKQVTELTPTSRASNGFGSTGIRELDSGGTVIQSPNSEDEGGPKDRY
jgi:dUTP pyrophosphatase